MTIVAVRDVLEEIAANAAALDADPAFPRAAFVALQQAGALVPPPTRGQEWDLVRAVSKADGSVGRIFEGHLNAVERLALEDIDPEGHWLGVWGADPAPGEGEPAHIDRRPAVRRQGVLLRCRRSGPGARDRPRRAGLRRRDRATSRSTGPGIAPVGCGRPRAIGSSSTGRPSSPRSATSRASHGSAPTRSGPRRAGPGSPTPPRTPRSRTSQADRRPTTSGRWRPAGSPPHRPTIDRWFEHAAAVEDHRDVSIQLRQAVADAGATILDEGARATGSRPFATGTALDRARRDFELFVLQHRLDPLVARLGRRTIEARR